MLKYILSARYKSGGEKVLCVVVSLSLLASVDIPIIVSGNLPLIPAPNGHADFCCFRSRRGNLQLSLSPTTFDGAY